MDGSALAYEGYFDWKNWEDYIGVKDDHGIAKFVECGCLVMETQQNGFLKKHKSICSILNIPFEEWDSRIIKKKLPLYNQESFAPAKRIDQDGFGETNGSSINSGVFFPTGGYVTDPQLSAHNDKILLNKSLFSRIELLVNKKSSLDLSTEQSRLLDETYKRFQRSGANLDEVSMERLTAINSSLSSLSVQFDQNVLKETNGYSMVIDNAEDLDGLPDEEIRQAALLAESEGEKGKWVFKPTRVSMYPFLTYATQRDLREELYNSYIQRGDNDNEFDNKAIIAKMIGLRKEKAALMGFDSHSEYVLDNTMAKTPENVNELLNTIWEPGIEKAKGEVKALQDLISSEGGNFKLAAWDWWHYSEKLRQEKFDFKEEEVKPYFSEDKVLQGAFEVANKLFDITFEESADLPKYRDCLLYTSPSPRDATLSRMPSSA